ncbi:polymerase [Spirochaetia bacterium]|nr:polymerase [Spirochaetia bacterium]
MVDFVRLQQVMKQQLELDRNIHTIDVSGVSLEAAVAEAAVLLNCPVRKIEYEISEKGSKGFMGSGKKNWKIHAYEKTSAKQEKLLQELFGEDSETFVPPVEDKDGAVYVHFSPEGALLKVVPPVGNGARITMGQAMEALQARRVTEIDKEIVGFVVQDMEAIYIKVGEFDHHSYNDAIVAVDIYENEMKAAITVSPPGDGGCDISVETVISILRNNKVVHGIKEDFLRDFADKPVYKEAVLIAEGDGPIHGKNAYMQYNFETNQSKIKFKEGVNGKIDFKELNIIQNVVENQPLAKKIPAENGIPGKTVTGRYISATNGTDIPLPVGKNVHVGEDTNTILADISGQVVEVAGKVNVEPVTTIEGDVNLRTGNIIFLGTVVITGSIEPGFSVQAAGNIEVNGTVEKANLDAEGDIIVHKGITGKNTGVVRAGKSIWARFIENTTVEAGNMVVVSDGIMNSQVSAEKRIICQGKRASIVGGHLRATEEINAKVIGSSASGTETVCEVGFDPKRKEEYQNFKTTKTEKEHTLEDVQLNIKTLISIKKQRKSLPEDKEASLQELMDKRTSLLSDIQKTKDEIERLETILNTMSVRGRVSASAKVYPGVRVIIRDYPYDVRAEYKATTFILQDKLVRAVAYEEPDEESTRGPDGYTTD